MNLTFVENIFFLELSSLETTFAEKKGLNFSLFYYHLLDIPPSPLFSALIYLKDLHFALF